jgi:hypothetical protein
MKLYAIACSRCGVESVREALGQKCTEYLNIATDEQIVHGIAPRCGDLGGTVGLWEYCPASVRQRPAAYAGVAS